jgi:hypothetical protein
MNVGRFLRVRDGIIGDVIAGGEGTRHVLGGGGREGKRKECWGGRKGEQEAAVPFSVKQLD